MLTNKELTMLTLEARKQLGYSFDKLSSQVGSDDLATVISVAIAKAIQTYDNLKSS